ncbi:hypothetical protein [Haladaptatus salinisoli]|uniref:hypothetical protein n=1 Tax=Haladaptatus salinisoli TaxID=2884876 RepID=UPI001D0BDBDD|nr:hypothetical protein [Haladaptatus salinisoli]
MRGALGINVVCAHTTIDLTDAEEKNARMRASVSRLINPVRDYETEESVDDDSPNLAAEAANAGRQLFETVQRSEQNTELVNFREKRAESQQVNHPGVKPRDIRPAPPVE